MALEKIGTSSLEDEVNDFKISLRIEPVAATIPIDLNAIHGYNILQADFKTDTGTLDFKLTIDSTDVEFSGGDESLAASSTAGSETTTSAFSVASGEAVDIVISNLATSPTLLSVDLYCRRT
jgi:hypothetical protein